MTILPPLWEFAWLQSFADLEAVASEHAVRIRVMNTREPYIIRVTGGAFVEFQPGGNEAWAMAHDGSHLWYARVSNPAVLTSEAFLRYIPARHVGCVVGSAEE
jgi:hypothetical protein